MREFDEEGVSARPVLRPRMLSGEEIEAARKRELSDPYLARPASLEQTVAQVKSQVRDRGEVMRIPPRALSTPPLVGKSGRRAVYPKRFKQSYQMAISLDLRELLVGKRMPYDASTEDTIRRLCGFPPREYL